jgi:cytochrome P450
MIASGGQGECMTTLQLAQIATPDNDRNKMAWLLKSERLMRGVARLGAFLGKKRDKPIKLGKSIIVTRHAQIVGALKRDTDFLSGPIYAERMGEIDFSFVLGMDRGGALMKEQLALYSSLDKVDLVRLRDLAAADADAILARSNGSLDAIQDYAWPICAATTQRMFGITGMDDRLFREAVRSIFYHIFLNVGSKPEVVARAKAAGDLLNGWLREEIARRRKAGEGSYGHDFLGQMLRQPGVSDDQVRRTMGGMLVGSIDTITGATARTLALLDRHPKLRRRWIENLNRPDILKHYYLETTRLWAQTPAMSREVAQDTVLAGQAVKKGQKLILLIHAGMFDAKAFQEPTVMRCDRPSGSYLHYAAGVHACAGRALSNLQVPMLVAKLLERDYQVSGKFKWAGPFPNRLPVTLGRN